MNYLPEPKDPAERVTVGFDFSAVTDTPTSPDVSVRVRLGAESAPALQRYGAPWVVGAMVYQQFSGGTHLVDYDIQCLANLPGGDRISVACVLAVRNRPT